MVTNVDNDGINLNGDEYSAEAYGAHNNSGWVVELPNQGGSVLVDLVHEHRFHLSHQRTKRVAYGPDLHRSIVELLDDFKIITHFLTKGRKN